MGMTSLIHAYRTQEFATPTAGVDEAGRGPWAGPVVAAAVVWKADAAIPDGIHDSKKLTAAKRDALFDAIHAAGDCAIAYATVEEIDRLNILRATMLAMQRAVSALPIQAQYALIDGNRLPDGLPCSARAVVKGDGTYSEIAAASILAKVTRDRWMQELAQEHPHYGWERNAGYGTAAHIEGIANHGITAHHRKSFKPIREILEAAA